MKIIIVFSLCCLAVVLANPTEEERAAATKECHNEMKLTEEQAADPSNEGCVLFCVHKKIGYLNADGTLKTWLSKLSHYEFIRKVYQICVEKAGGDSCKVSYCLEHSKESKD